MKRMVTVALPLLILALVFMGCEGDQGPAGPPGPPGDPGSDFTYVGEAGQACMHCHATTVDTWSTTGHQGAYTGLDAEDQGNLYCLQCHTTGFDSEVAFGDTEIDPANLGDDVYGYDDYFGVDTEEAAARRAALEGVQCEACHGPMGPEFNTHRPLISFATYKKADGSWESLCYPCHETQLDEYLTSGHGTVTATLEEFNDEHYTGRSSCDRCHTSEGFIRENDPAYADYEFPEEQTFIGCPTCHDPHAGEAAGGNVYQLRNLRPTEVAYHAPTSPGDVDRPRMEGYGSAQICAQCHQARRDDDHVAGQIADGYAHFGPHGSPQMDMFIGAGSYEIPGYTYDGEHGHQTTVTEACVKCHMVRETFLHGETVDHAFHEFSPDVGNCEPCHVGIADFDVNGAQTEVLAKMDELAVLLGYADAATMLDTYSDDNFEDETWQREAAYALVFVASDGSHGVHNPDYAMSLLDNAIAYATLQTALVTTN